MALDFLLRLLGAKRRASKPQQTAADETIEESQYWDPLNPFPEPIVIEFRDVIDLHSIPPRQVRAVVEDYLEQARNRGVRWVRIIHGKGIGTQREIVRSILERASFVIDFHDAPPEAGGWGATIVTLEKSQPQ